MKKQMIFGLVVLMMIALAACGELNTPIAESGSVISTDTGSGSISNETASSEHEDSTATSSLGTSDSNNPGIGGALASDYRYNYNASEMWAITKIVGDESFKSFFDDIEANWQEPRPYDEPPYLYQLIKHFDISKEAFIEMNEDTKKRPWGGTVYTEETIELLYCGDENRIKKELAHPLSLYKDGNVYSAREVYAIIESGDKAAIEKMFTTENEFEQYVERIKSYNELGQPFIENMEDSYTAFKK